MILCWTRPGVVGIVNSELGAVGIMVLMRERSGGIGPARRTWGGGRSVCGSLVSLSVSNIELILLSGSRLYVFDHTFAKLVNPEEPMLPSLDVLVVVVTETGGVSSVDEMVPGMERRRKSIMPP